MNVVGLREDKIYCLIKISLFEEWLKWGGFLPLKKIYAIPPPDINKKNKISPCIYWMVQRTEP